MDEFLPSHLRGIPAQAGKLREEVARAEAETREQQFRILANSIPQLAWMADHEGYIFCARITKARRS